MAATMTLPGARSASGTAQSGGGAAWAAYLLASPTRSSLTGVVLLAELASVVSLHNGEVPGEASPEETKIHRPWRVAETIACDDHEAARQVALRASRASGFRARLAAFRGGGGIATPEPIAEEAQLPHLDSLTYVSVEFRHPALPGRSQTLRALVDTGYTHCDLKRSVIADLGLPASSVAHSSYFETAAGRHVETALYEAIVVVQGQSACVRVSEAEDEEEAEEDSERDGEDVDREFGFSSDTDDAVLGCEALSRLGLLVDCARRTVVPRSEVEPAQVVSFYPGSMHVPLTLSAPGTASRRVEVGALVDTGSTDVDLDPSKIALLGLVVDPSEIIAQFETAGGITIEAPIYRAIAEVLGRTASIRVSPSEVACAAEAPAPPPGAAGNHDEALLGHDALAALGLLVDCAGRRLLRAAEK